MKKCKACQRESDLISAHLGVCLDCIREDFDKCFTFVQEAHSLARREFNLPWQPPCNKNGVACSLCVNECRIGVGETGFCGLRRNVQGRLIGPDSREANLSCYFDALPTNCVADWVCPAGTGCGFPEYSYTKGPEYGFKNLAIFFNGCSFDCLFCQNWQFRLNISTKNLVSLQELASCIDSRTACVCYFGGDPSCQINYAIAASRLALRNKKNKILRICWETNGSMEPHYLEQMFELSFRSGGCIKFDLKAWTKELNIALCGVSNQRTKENFAKLAGQVNQRPSPPLLIASTLLVPGYVDEYEVEMLAGFIAKLDPDIPYSLLAFYPNFYINDLPTTSKGHALACKEKAESVGLRNVHIGNVHLLSNTY